MDRQLAYTGAIPQTGDILKAEKATMVALGYAMRAIVGDCSTSVQVDGLACAPITPVANLSVTVGVGSIYSAETVDANAFGDLGTDTTHTIVKQGILADPVTLTVTPPVTSGYSQVFLVQVAFSEVDAGSVVLPYYNAANPSVPFSGPANAGTSNFTVRQGKIVVQLKAGTAATTGTQTTPSPDAGYTGLYAITVANGATSVISGNIAALASAPFIALKLPQVRSAIRAQADNYLPTIGGSANALTATIAPIPPDWASLTGVPFRFVVSTTNTGAATLNLNGLGAKDLVYPGDNSALLAGELVSGAVRTGLYDGTRVQLIDVGSRARSGVPFRNVALFTSSGTFDPSALGLTTLDRILVFCWGAGGGAASTTGTQGASGAGGGLAIKSMDCPASSVTVTIGAGGAGNNAGSYGATGGTSSFGPHCSATGGVGGSAGAGTGGAGTGGSINLNGSNGCDILSPAQDWAPGGAAPFMGPGMLNNSGGNPIGSGGAASSGAPQADAGTAGAVIVFY